MILDLLKVTKDTEIWWTDAEAIVMSTAHKKVNH